MIHQRYTTTELEAMPTLNSGWTADLKYEERGIRVWLERGDMTDGHPFDNAVCVEHYDGRSWNLVETYNGDDVDKVIPA